MHRDVIGSGGDEVTDITYGFIYHEMYVEHGAAVLSERLHDYLSEGNVRDKGAVHHVEMQPADTGIFKRGEGKRGVEEVAGEG